jgi:hypothetical protein
LTDGLIFSSFVRLALIAMIVGILYGVVAFLFVLMAHALFMAHVRGNASACRCIRAR